MNKLVLVIASTLFSTQVLAAGVRSTDHNCAELQTAVAANGYLLINDSYVVANRSLCAIHQSGYSAAVPTADSSSCTVGLTCEDNSNGGE